MNRTVKKSFAVLAGAVGLALAAVAACVADGAESPRRARVVLASSVAKLDSDMRRGGGTDDTAALQKVLDLAKDGAGVKLVMDGAALVKGLRVHSNTTIECLGSDCGFFQAPQSNGPLVSNARMSKTAIVTTNVCLVGGTYNQDCPHQLHDFENRWVFGFEFRGVENLVLRDLTVVDFSTFAVAVGNFRRVTIERVWLDLPHHEDGRNQDGFHFWGPGRFLTVRDVGGRVGDDFMNIGPDEEDEVSSIEDVLVDGVQLDDADQAIRLLSRNKGRLDRVTVRNVIGTYRSFGFYINNWFSGAFGNFGDLFFENIDLKPLAPNYTYRPPVLFSLGGNIDSFVLKNVRTVYPRDNRALVELGLPIGGMCARNVGEPHWYKDEKRPFVKSCVIDGVTVLESGDSKDLDQVCVYGPVGNLTVRNVQAVKDPGVAKSGHVVRITKYGRVDNLLLQNVSADGCESPVRRD